MHLDEKCLAKRAADFLEARRKHNVKKDGPLLGPTSLNAVELAACLARADEGYTLRAAEIASDAFSITLTSRCLADGGRERDVKRLKMALLTYNAVVIEMKSPVEILFCGGKARYPCRLDPFELEEISSSVLLAAVRLTRTYWGWWSLASEIARDADAIVRAAQKAKLGKRASIRELRQICGKYDVNTQQVLGRSFSVLGENDGPEGSLFASAS